MANKYMKFMNKCINKCLTSLATREMQIKITMRNHFTSYSGYYKNNKNADEDAR
jgi:hypothetical protein